MTELNVSEVIGEDGSFTPAFHEQIPKVLGEGYQDYKTDKIKSLPDLVKSYATLERAQGKKIDEVVKSQGFFKLPAQDAKPEDIKAFHKAIGVPDSPDGYQLKRPDKLPEGMVYNEDIEKAAKTFFHESGVPAAMAQKITDWFNQMQIARFESAVKEVQSSRTQAEEALKADVEWQGDKYKANMNLLSQYIDRIFPGQIRKAIEAQGVDLQAMPEIRKELLKVARAVIPDASAASSGTPGSGGKTSIYNHPSSKVLK